MLTPSQKKMCDQKKLNEEKKNLFYKSMSKSMFKIKYITNSEFKKESFSCDFKWCTKRKKLAQKEVKFDFSILI